MDAANRRLQIAVGAASLEVLAQVALLLGDDAHNRPLFLLLKLPFCWAALKRHAAGYLGLWIWEIAGVVAVLYARSQLPWLVAIGVAGAVMVLLGRAISAYPTVEWRPR